MILDILLPGYLKFQRNILQTLSTAEQESMMSETYTYETYSKMFHACCYSVKFLINHF